MPTLAMLAAAGVTFDAWLRFVVPLLVALFVLAAVAIGVGVMVGVQAMAHRHSCTVWSEADAE